MATDIDVTVVYASAPRTVHEVALRLPPGSTVADAIAASGLLQTFPEAAQADVGLWGRRVTPRQVLRQDDRVELYRPLRVDPKVARRERFARQGARTAGLFAKRRAGAKAGY
ncbi:MAG: RnfH family protein [Hylemonella sp.]